MDKKHIILLRYQQRGSIENKKGSSSFKNQKIKPEKNKMSLK
jgi:hypothetical protein